MNPRRWTTQQEQFVKDAITRTPDNLQEAFALAQENLRVAGHTKTIKAIEARYYTTIKPAQDKVLVTVSKDIAHKNVKNTKRVNGRRPNRAIVRDDMLRTAMSHQNKETLIKFILQTMNDSDKSTMLNNIVGQLNS